MTAVAAVRHAPNATRAAQLGVVVNIALTIVKLVGGIVGHSYALVADAAESGFDLFGSLAVWTGVRIADRCGYSPVGKMDVDRARCARFRSMDQRLTATIGDPDIALA